MIIDEFLLENLDVSYKIISIKNICHEHLKDIGHDLNNLNTTFENAQVRERTQILFDLANDLNGIVLGTGDLSEIAMGFTTYEIESILKNDYKKILKFSKRKILKLISNYLRFKETRVEGILSRKRICGSGIL